MITTNNPGRHRWAKGFSCQDPKRFIKAAVAVVSSSFRPVILHTDHTDFLDYTI